jgi:hypothetical protein
MRKKTVRCVLRKVAVGITIMMACGCASNRIDLVDNGMVTVETIDSKPVSVSRASVYQDGADLVISGTVKRQYHTVIADRGHIDIIVLAPDGAALTRMCGHYKPRLSRKKRAAHFTARLPLPLQRGSVVRIVHHSGHHGS